jgi:hypothetical protein
MEFHKVDIIARIPTAASFPFQDPYTKCMSAYSEFVNVRHFDCDHNAATLS